MFVSNIWRNKSVTIAGDFEGQLSKGLRSRLSYMAFEQIREIFIVPHLLWHGTLVFAVSSKLPLQFSHQLFTMSKEYTEDHAAILTQIPSGIYIIFV